MEVWRKGWGGGRGEVVSYWFLTPGQPYRSYISGRRAVVVVGGRVVGGRCKGTGAGGSWERFGGWGRGEWGGGREREGLHSLVVEARKNRRASKRMTAFWRIAGCHRVLSFSPWRGVAFPFQAGRHSPPTAFNSQFARLHKLGARHKKVVEAGRKGNTCVMIASLWQWCGARQNVWHGLKKLSVSSSSSSFFFGNAAGTKTHIQKKRKKIHLVPECRILCTAFQNRQKRI